MKIRYGILGCGDIAKKRVADAIRRDACSELVGACRRDSEKLASFATLYNVPFATTDRRELLARADIDAVYVATPVANHLEDVLDAAAAGKHVLVEKPMALSPHECDRMIQACESDGVQLGVAYYRRFYPVVQRFKEIIAAQRLGTVLSINAMTGNRNHFSPDDWRVVVAQGGGGPLMDIGSHRIDVFLDLLGPVDYVHACADTIAADYEAEDCATVTFRFRGGAHGVLQTYFGTAVVPDQLTLVGTDGRLSTDDLNAGTLTLSQHGQTISESHPPHENLHAPLIEDFSQAILSKRSPTVTGAAGRAVNAIIEKAYESARVS